MHKQPRTCPQSTGGAHSEQERRVSADLKGGVRDEVLQESDDEGVVPPLPLQLEEGGREAVQGCKVQGHVHYHATQVGDQEFLILSREGGGGGGGGRSMRERGGREGEERERERGRREGENEEEEGDNGGGGESVINGGGGER